MDGTVDIGGGRRGIPVPVTHEVPGIWRDARAGRDRMLAATVQAVMPLRVAEPRSVVRNPGPGAGPHERGFAIADTTYDALIDGMPWRRWAPPEEAGPGRARLDAFVAHLGGERACRDLRMQLPDGLTGRRGAATPLPVPHPASAQATWRADAESAAWARDYLARFVAFDGTDVFVCAKWPYGSRGNERHKGHMDRVAALLEVAARLPGRARPEIERLSDPLRRAVALEGVGALPHAAIGDALRQAALLAHAAWREIPTRGNTFVRAVTIAASCERDAALYDAPADPGDEDALAGLAP